MFHLVSYKWIRRTRNITSIGLFYNVCGEWKDGVPVGKGTFTYPDGTKYVGGLKKGKRWNGIEYYKNGNIIGKYVNGVFKVVSQVKKRQKGVFYVGVLFNRSLVSESSLTIR